MNKFENWMQLINYCRLQGLINESDKYSFNILMSLGEFCNIKRGTEIIHSTTFSILYLFFDNIADMVIKTPEKKIVDIKLFPS